MGMDKSERLAMLKDEYAMLQEFYEDIDHRGLLIKGWSVTVAITGIGAGVVYSRVLFLGAFVAALLFWYLEGYWRGLSFFFSRRILDIEKAIREGDWVEMDPLQIYYTWDKAYKKHGDQTWRYMFKPASLWPHLLVAVVSLGMFLLSVLGWTGW
jgi:hypothetical protein